jgi:hypothetical protein
MSLDQIYNYLQLIVATLKTALGCLELPLKFQWAGGSPTNYFVTSNMRLSWAVTIFILEMKALGYKFSYEIGLVWP